MTNPTTIPGISLEADVVPERPWTRWFRAYDGCRASTPEDAAQACLALFVAAAFRPGAAQTHSLASALIAHGAVDEIARHAELDRGARARLERSLLRAIAGPGWRAVHAWRRTLGELGSTPQGRRLRRSGGEALRAWLGGEAPAARLEKALHADPC